MKQARHGRKLSTVEVIRVTFEAKEIMLKGSQRTQVYKFNLSTGVAIGPYQWKDRLLSIGKVQVMVMRDSALLAFILIFLMIVKRQQLKHMHTL